MILKLPAHVRYWHRADLPVTAINVCSSGSSRLISDMPLLLNLTQSGHFAKPVAYPGVDEWLAQLKSATNRGQRHQITILTR